MCQVNTFMFKDGELDGEKLMEIIKIFQKKALQISMNIPTRI